MAVLDSELRVRGVKGLRVADTSVMPLLNQVCCLGAEASVLVHWEHYLAAPENSWH
jgi:hypothetical protein